MTETLNDIIKQLQKPNPYPIHSPEHNLFEYKKSQKKDLHFYIQQLQKKSTPNHFSHIIVYSLNNGEVKNTVGCNSIEQAREIGRTLYNSYLVMDFIVDSIMIFDHDWNELEKIEVLY